MDIGNSVLAAGNSAFEVLKRVPGVTTDKDDNILLKRASCKILIDGRTSYLTGDQLTTYLKTLPADAINKIELITNPSGKYDAEGSAGIINIILKKNKANGLNGTASAGVGYGKYQKENAGLNLNYRHGKINLFGNGYLGYSESYNRLTYNTAINNNGNIQLQNRDQYWHPYALWSSFKAGIDYSISKKSTIGFLLIGSTDNTKAKTDDNTNITDASHTPYQYINSIKHDTSHMVNATWNINSRTELDTAGSEITFDADYVHYTSASQSVNEAGFYDAGNNTTRYPYLFRNNEPSDIAIMSAKTDLIYYFKNKTKLEAGLKYSNVKTDNNLIADSVENGNWIRDHNRSNHFIYSEMISAGYITLSRSFNKTSVQAGLRAEESESTGTSLTLHTIQKQGYLDIFPTLFVTQELNDDNQLTLSYSKRIERPSYQSLNPFTWYIDPYTLFAGNPYLKPAYTHSLELKHSYKDMLFTSLGYSHTAHEQIDGIIQDKTSGVTTNIPENANTSDYLQLGIAASHDFGKIWNSNLNINLSYGRDRSAIPGYSYNTDAFDADCSNDNTFTLPRNYKVQTNFYYSLPTRSGLTKIRSSYGLDAGVQKQLWHNRATIKVSASSIVGTSAYRAHIIGDNLDITWINKWEGRKINLSFVWKFGNMNLKTTNRHGNTSSEDEKNRIKSTR